MGRRGHVLLARATWKPDMNLFLAVTVAGSDTVHRFLGFDWSAIMLVGLAGNLVFSTRFMLQWIASEKAGRSVIPNSFWYWSIFGSVLMCIYFYVRHDPVGILAYLPNSMIYLRNLHLRQKEGIPDGNAPSDHATKLGVTAMSDAGS